MDKIIKYRLLAVGNPIIVSIFMVFLTFFSESTIGKELQLFGHGLTFETSLSHLQLHTPYTKVQIQQQLEWQSKKALTGLVDEMDAYSLRFKMDDMAYQLMARTVSKAYLGNTNEARLLQYALLKEKGYNVILGFSEDNITVYGYLDFKVHNVISANFDGLTYTDLSFDKHSATCNEELLEPSKTGRAITMNEHQAPQFDALSKGYALSFEFEGMTYTFNGNYNQSLVQYYKMLPDVEFGQVYLNYQLSPNANATLIADLKKATRGMFLSKQIDFLLQFSQKAFTYKSDIDALGEEKFAFPEEILANPYADCEDKSILFAYLAKQVLDLPSVALVYYTDHHLNVGVAFNHKDAYNFIYNNQKYLVCEPSGLGFKPGDNIYDVKRANIVNW